MKHQHSIVLAVFCAASAPSLGQSNVAPNFKFAYGENLGWLDWRSANGGTQGARLDPRFFSGFVWGENAGWLNLGDGQPSTCDQYPPPPTGWGVNIDSDNKLSGFAWGENIGWVNFGPWPKGGPNDQRVTLVPATGRLIGYAWAENAGWINLSFEAPGQGVTFCYANCDGSGGSPVLTANDFVCFITAYAAGDPYANCDGSTVASCLTANDFVCFLNRYSAGCQ